MSAGLEGARAEGAIPAGAPPALWGAPLTASLECDESGQTRGLPPLAFVLPGRAREAAPGSCPAGALREAPVELVQPMLAAPLGERTYHALYPDGHTVAVRLVGLVSDGSRLLVTARRESVEAELAAAPQVPDGGAAPAMAPLTPRSEQRMEPAIALLLHPSAASPPQPGPSPASIAGVVRRRLGRESLVARGRFVGKGESYAAVWKRRGDTFALAVFGDAGDLRLYEMLRWHANRGTRARPVEVVTVRGLSAQGQDGLYLVGEGDRGAVRLLIEFEGRTARAHAPPDAPQ